MLRLRPWREEDAGAVVSWIGNEFAFRQWCADRYDHYPVTAEDVCAQYRAQAGADFYPMTAFDESGIVGHMILRFTDSAKTVLRFGFVIVDSRKRGRGYGREMLRLALIMAFEVLKAETVTLGVFENNPGAYRCYRAAGFEDTGERKRCRILGREWICREMAVRAPSALPVTVEEIPPESAADFWDIHIRYLTEDGIVTDEEDIDYFRGEEYRGILEAHMRRDRDRHHLVYFRRGGQRIGAASYCTYQSEDGKCFIMDFWVFPPFRGRGTGHRCYEALERYTRADGAACYELNSTKPDSVRFWKSIGFADNGEDEYGMPLLIKKG